MDRSLISLLDEGVGRGLITGAQRDALLLLHAEAPPDEPRREAQAGLNAVNIAYTIGALFVLFACGWFLVRQWADLGGWGVLGVSVVYATVLVVASRQLARLGFTRASAIAVILAISMTPVATWALMDLTGEWPRGPTYDAFWRYGPYMATRYLVLDLATVLVVLLAWRRQRFPALMLLLAVALWWTWFHLSRLIDVGYWAEDYQNWIVLAAGLALLALADTVERWQRRTDVRVREGDYAGPLWYAGLAAFSIGYLIIWSDARAWKHLMPFVAAGLLALSLATGRRPISFVGVAGVFGYLAYLASDVFKTGAAFPIVLAALGVLSLVATVWLQRRLPALVSRMAGTDRMPPWPIALSWLPMAFALVMAGVSLEDAGERRAERERLDREAILQRHREVQRDVREGRRPQAVPRPVPPRQ